MHAKSRFTFDSCGLRLVAFAALAILVSASPPAFASPLVVTIVGGRLVIDGIEPGASVALLSAAHEPAYYMSRIVSHRELLVDDDGDGKIEYKVPNGVAFQSVWIVTDIATGETIVTTPAGYRPIVMTQQGAGRGNPVNVNASGVDIGRDRADILLVRPKEGAWALPVRKGLVSQPGAVKGRAAVAFPTLHPLKPAFGNSPTTLKPGDVIAIVDAERMEYWVTTSSKSAN